MVEILNYLHLLYEKKNGLQSYWLILEMGSVLNFDRKCCFRGKINTCKRIRMHFCLFSFFLFATFRSHSIQLLFVNTLQSGGKKGF